MPKRKYSKRSAGSRKRLKRRGSFTKRTRRVYRKRAGSSGGYIKRNYRLGSVRKKTYRKPAPKFMAKYPIYGAVRLNDFAGGIVSEYVENVQMFSDDAGVFGFRNINDDVFATGVINAATASTSTSPENQESSNIQTLWLDSLHSEMYFERRNDTSGVAYGLRVMVLAKKNSDSAISVSDTFLLKPHPTGTQMTGYDPVAPNDGFFANNATNPGRNAYLMLAKPNLYDYDCLYDRVWVHNGAVEDNTPDRTMWKEKIPICKYMKYVNTLASTTRINPRDRIQIITLCCDLRNDYDTGAGALLTVEATGSIVQTVRVDAKAVY